MVKEASRASNLPLAGVRVLEFTVVVSGPIATAKLADMGAEVIRVESIQQMGHGERVREARLKKEHIQNHPVQRRSFPDGDPGLRPWNRYALFNSHSRNKLSMTVDIRNSEGMEVLERLIAMTDVFIENHATDYMERRGITYEWLKERKPDIIMVRMPGFGTTGPSAYLRTLGTTAESHAGRSNLSGYPDMDASGIPWVYPGDAIAGAVAAFATLSALHYRNRTGKGQMIDLGLAESTLCVLGAPFLDYTVNGRIAQNLGNRHPYAAPHGCYPARGDDRWVNITVATDQEWKGFCEALDNLDWTKERIFADPSSRWENQDDLDALVVKWTQSRGPDEIVRELQDHGVPAGRVMDVEDCFCDPHLKSRNYFEEVTHPEAGTHLHPGMFYKLSKTPLSIRRHAPRLGEDNEYIYKDLLNYSDEEYVDLERQGHIGMDYAPHIP